MNLKKIVNNINNIEKAIKIDNLNLLGFNPWPYIRLEIINQIGEEKTRNSKKSFIQNAQRVYNSLISYLKDPIKKETNEIVFFTRSSELQDIVEEEYFNRYSDSFIHFFEKDYKIKVLESKDSFTNKNIRLKNKDVSYIDFIIRKTFIISRIKYLFLRNKFSMLDVNSQLQKELSFTLNEKKINQQLYYIHELSKVFEKILQNYNTKVVFLTCFYRPEAMAMSLACNRLGIITVEYQHGAQNDNHLMYTNWENIPSAGYQIIPDIFWMWGKTNKKRIDKWAVSTTKHKAVVGGNLWLSYNMKKVSPDDINKIENSKVTILVSLQGDRFLPDFFIDFLNKYGSNYNWYFRNHPRVPVSNRIENILNQYAIIGIDAVASLDLYSLLKIIDINITGFSTVAFEAQSFLKSTIFIHENAKDGFKNLIGENGLFYADNVSQLKVYLDEEDKNSKIEDFYITANEEIAVNALREILK